MSTNGNQDIVQAIDALSRAVVVADSVAPGFVTPSMNHSWVSYGAGYSDVGYAIDHQRLVSLRGLIKNGTLTAAGTVLFTLPPSHRPQFNYIFPARLSTGVGEIRVLSNGDVTAGDGGISVGWTSLNGISFYAI